jgi:hypothetical protein
LCDPHSDGPAKPDHPEWRVRYIIQDHPFDDFKSVDDASTDIVADMLYADEMSGCYSEWTCGVGDYDFLFSNGHSILNELASFENKFAWIKFNDD